MQHYVRVWSICFLVGAIPLLAATQSASHPQLAANISKMPFGTTRDGRGVELYTLRNANGLTAKVMTYGAIIYSFEIPGQDGKLTNVTLNRETLADYEQKSPCFGALLGRFANRIARGEFTLDGHQISLPRNGGPNHIHGGAKGFDKRVWQAEAIQEADSVALKLHYLSQAGEEGYPGTLNCTVRYELNNSNEWKMEYTATTDQPTPINLSNHAYWNLAGAESGTVLDQVLTVNADHYLTVDDTLIPTGETPSVAGTPLDFRRPHTIGERIDLLQAKPFGGYDHCLVINHKVPGALTFCARLEDRKSGRVMEVFTTQPGVQLFSANFGAGAFEGPGGYAYPGHAGFCLETEHFPDSPNHAQFPSTILRPGQTYHETTVHKFIQRNVTGN